MRVGAPATHTSPNHRRADEIPGAGRLDRNDRNRIVRADLQKLQAGDRSLSSAGNHGDGRAIRQWARFFIACFSGGKGTNTQELSQNHFVQTVQKLSQF